MKVYDDQTLILRCYIDELPILKGPIFHYQLIKLENFKIYILNHPGINNYLTYTIIVLYYA